jgi:hypothetical protein
MDFINENEVTNRAKTSKKTPELLAKYCDNLLKSRDKIIATELEDLLTNAVLFD